MSAQHVSVSLAHRGDDHVRRRRRTVLAAGVTERRSHRLGGDRLSARGQEISVGPRPRQQCRRGAHARLGCDLRPPDPGQLRVRLAAPPAGDRPLVGLDRDAVCAQPVGHGNRQLGVGDRRPDPDLGGHP
jgi:hypothetical protein